MAESHLLGFSCCMISGVGFAVNYLPVKSCDIGDGIFFSAAMSVGILLVGLVTGMFLTSTPGVEIPAFEPLAAVGGAMWMLGNLMCPYIIKVIGLGLGLTIWDLSNMLMGWFTGYFGLFGIPKEDNVKTPSINYVGLVMASLSLIFFSLASAYDTSDMRDVMNKSDAEPASKEGSMDIENGLDRNAQESAEDLKCGTETKSASKAIVGFSMAILAGVLFGTNFDLPVDLKNGVFGEDHSKHIMDYVFSHFIGISAAASISLLVYVVTQRKQSHMPRQLVLPSLVSGVIWAIAQVAWFQANIDLGFTIAFPIIGSLPGIIGLLIGFCFLGEIRTRRSRILALLGLILRVPGVLLIALSCL